MGAESGFPAPVEPAESVDVDACPAAVAKAYRDAQGFGWVVDVRRAVGYVPNSKGEPTQRTERVEIAEDAENPNATKTKTVKLEELKTVEAYAIRARKGDVAYAGVWHLERDKRDVRKKDSKQKKDGTYSFRAGDVYYRDACTNDLSRDNRGNKIAVSKLGEFFSRVDTA